MFFELHLRWRWLNRTGFAGDSSGHPFHGVRDGIRVMVTGFGGISSLASVA